MKGSDLPDPVGHVVFRALVDNLVDDARLLVAHAGDGAEALVFFDEYQRSGGGVSRLQIFVTDSEDRGARSALTDWANAHKTAVTVEASFGDELLPQLPVQQDLFAAASNSPAKTPEGLRNAPFDVVFRPSPADALGDEPEWIDRLLSWASVDALLLVRFHKDLFGREFAADAVSKLGLRTQILAAREEGPGVWFLLRVVRAGDGDGALALRVRDVDQARDLAALESSSTRALRDATAFVGATATLGFDDVWLVPRSVATSLATMPLIRGGDVHSWRVGPLDRVLWPYDEAGHRRLPADQSLVVWLSRHRTLLERRQIFGESLRDRDVFWYEYAEHYPERWGTIPVVVMSRRFQPRAVAVLESPAVIPRSGLAVAPIPGVDPYFLAGVLASSTAWQWMQSRFVGVGTGGVELTSTGLAELPLPAQEGEIADVARAAARRARSFAALESAIQGEPGRLAERLRSTAAANQRVAEELERLHLELDSVVAAAYRPAVRPFSMSAKESTKVSFEPTLQEWLTEQIDRAFRAGDLATDRAVAAQEVAAWVASDPLKREALRLASATIEEVLLEASVPLEPEAIFSESGARKLHRWAQGAPHPFDADDFAARELSVPAVAAKTHQQRIWRHRGRFNIPRERFLLLVERSAARGAPIFAWAEVTDKVRRQLARVDDPSGGLQVDLDVLARIRSALDDGLSPISTLLGRASGPTIDVAVAELALRALVQSGAAVEVAGCYRRSS